MQILRRVLHFFLIIMAFIIIGLFVFHKFYMDKIVHSNIKESIENSIENEFEFSFGSIKMFWLCSKAELKDINLVLLYQSDTVGYFKGDLQIDMKGWINLIFNQRKRIKNLVFNETEIYYAIDFPLIIKNEKEKGGQQIEIQSTKFSGKLNIAKFHNKQNGQLSTYLDFAANLNYSLVEDVCLSQFIDHITHFHISQLQYFLPGGFYNMEVAEIVFENFNEIAIKQFSIKTIDSRKVFAQRKILATDNISVSIDSILLVSTDTRIDERVYIDLINLDQSDIEVYRNNNYSKNYKFKPILVDLLEKIYHPVYIREMNVSNMFIKYEELSKNAKQSGDLFFSQTNGRILNITNVKDSIEVFNKMLIQAEAKFYGEGLLKTNMSYELASPSGQFQIQGSLGQMQMQKLNAIMSKLEPVMITSGQIDKLYFNFGGSRTHSKGEMQFKYSNLNMQLLEGSKLKSRIARNIISSIGNTVLRNSNPARNGTFRIGAIDRERDTSTTMFHYWWLSLESGLMSTLGITSDKKEVNFKTKKNATLLDKIGLGKN